MASLEQQPVARRFVGALLTPLVLVGLAVVAAVYISFLPADARSDLQYLAQDFLPVVPASSALR
jgi:hypothetical protein